MFLLHNPTKTSAQLSAQECFLTQTPSFCTLWVNLLIFIPAWFLLSVDLFCLLFEKKKINNNNKEIIYSHSLSPVCVLLSRSAPRFPEYSLRADPAAALWVSAGESEVLPLTVELISFPGLAPVWSAWPLCRRHIRRPTSLSPVDKSTVCWPNQVQIYWYILCSVICAPTVTASSDCFMFQSDGFIIFPPVTVGSYQWSRNVIAA